jgi:hypothetical protein
MINCFTCFNFSAKDSVVSSAAPEEVEPISVVVEGASVVLKFYATIKTLKEI